MGRRYHAAVVLALGLLACATSPSGNELGGTDTGTAPPGSDSGQDASTADGGGDATPSGPTGGKRVFATSSQQAGDFGGIAGGDAICQAAASAAKLGGTFKAWLSDGSTKASARIAAVGPWSLVDGTPVFPLANVSSPLHDLDMDESGQTGQKGLVWTGTSPGGGAMIETCTGWSSRGVSGTSGYPHVTTQWTDDGTGGSPCSP